MREQNPNRVILLATTRYRGYRIFAENFPDKPLALTHTPGIQSYPCTQLAVTAPEMAAITINPDGFDKLRWDRGITTDSELAQLVGIHQSNISRVLSGKAKPSAQFIAGVVAAFGWSAGPTVFTVIEDEAA